MSICAGLTRGLCGLVLWGALGSVAPAPVQASPTQDAMHAGTEAFRGNQLPRARALFLQAYADGLRSSKLLYNLGVVHYRLGEYAAARGWFLRVADDPAVRQIAEYNLARCAERLEDPEQAVMWYRRAARGDDARIAALARRAQAEMTRLARRNLVHAARLGLGFDSAVVGLVDQVTSLPTDSPDLYVEALASVGQHDRPWLEGEWRWDVTAYALMFDELSFADIQSLGGRLHWGRGSGQRRFGLAVSGSHEWLDTQAYQARSALRADHALAWGRFWFRQELGAEWLNSQGAFADGIEGLRADVGLLAVTALGGGVAGWRLGAEHNERRNDVFSPRRASVDLFWQSPRDWLWRLSPSLQWRQSDYPDSEVRPREHRWRGGLRLESDLDGGATLRIDADYEDNRSDDPLRRYAHARVQFSLGYAL